jgi:hypothetical protein
MSKGKKYDQGKPDYSLLPFNATDEVVQVLTYGAAKYDRHNWLKIEKHRYQAAAMRHFSAYMQGESQDPESGLPHLAHSIASLMFIMELERNEAEPKNSKSVKKLRND